METGRSGYPSEDLIKRLKRWKKERPLHHIFERRARGMIVSAAKQDLENPLEEFSPSYVLEETVNSRRAMDTLLQHGEYRKLKKDTVTGEPFWLRMRKEDDIYIAEEVRLIVDQERIISQAQIRRNGEATLTLNFDTRRFNRRRLGFDRNPRILNDSHFPRAAVETFNLLVGSATNTTFINNL